MPFSQNVFNAMAIVVRTTGDPKGFAADLRRTSWEIDPDQPIYDTSTLEQAIARRVFLPRLRMTLLAAFAGAALLLAIVGMYGVIAFGFAAHHGNGLRMALGAGARDLTGLVIWNSMSFVALGMAVGLGGAFVFARFLSGQLFGVSPLDPWVYLSVALALILAALIASFSPGTARYPSRPDGGPARGVSLKAERRTAPDRQLRPTGGTMIPAVLPPFPSRVLPPGGLFSWCV